MKVTHLLLCGVLALATPLLAVEDTPENRAKEAEKFFEAASPRDLLMEMAAALATSVPDGEKQKFKEMLAKHLDYDAFTKNVKEAMARHFSVAELTALTEFYKTDAGKSAMKKMGAYTAELMPLVQTEILKAQQKALNEQGGLTALPPGAAPGKGAPMPAPGASPTPTPAASPSPAPAPAPAPAPGAAPAPTTPAQAGQPSPAPAPAPAQPGQPAPTTPPAPGPVGGIPTTSQPQVFPATKGS